ncbi:methyltransferase-like protein 27 isoform X2 [Sphaeramia orbicularis]|nr:methyltransferase-like protein 27 isoform X2 [Sphaeramia orbicularis]XP_029998642.1 methyltransferase-like protein 27 isoform X2 [Sphaeramia orbicularis]XP_029998643.1 methyltransferase-like protein 27 isoform X2 [Sphaeramia orbicularis]
MSVRKRTVREARNAFQSSKATNPKVMVDYYTTWAENYEEDHRLMSFQSPHLAVDFLSEHFIGSPEETRVLDVACGTGYIAKLMKGLGYRHFVGVDGSKGMLELAAKTGLYQDLKLALLGTEPLPVETSAFDVVIITGALDAGFVPVSVIRELCNAAKPGGLVCMARGDHTGAPAAKYKEDLQKELHMMEEEGLWSLVGTKLTDRYMEDPHLVYDGDEEGIQEKQYISGTVYLYRTSISASM